MMTMHEEAMMTIPDLKAAFLRICDLFNAEEQQRNWFIYLEEDKNRIIIERVIGEKTKISFFNDRDVKEEPIYDHAFDPQQEVFEDDCIWSTEGDDNEKLPSGTDILSPPLTHGKDSLSESQSYIEERQDADKIDTSENGSTIGDEGVQSQSRESEKQNISSVSPSKRPTTRSTTDKSYTDAAVSQSILDEVSQNFDSISGAFACRLCGKSLRSPKLALKHFNSKHKESPPPEPTKKLPKRISGSSESISKSASSGNFACPICERTFKNGSALKRHLKSIHASEVKKWSEDRTSKISKASRDNRVDDSKQTKNDPAFVRASDGSGEAEGVARLNQSGSAFDGVLLYDDIDDELEFGAGEAGEEEEKEKELGDNSEKVLDESSGALVVPVTKETCMFCEKELSCPRALKRHIATRHLGQRKTYSCPVCDKVFHCQNKMREHILRDHPESEHAKQRFTCLVCSEEFLTRLKMREHMNRNHSTETKSCSVCNKSFKQSYSLEYHIDSIHPDLPNPFADGECHLCDYCGSSFSTKGSLNLHRYTRHVDVDKHDERKLKRRKQSAEKKNLGVVKEKQPKEKKEFVCKICGKVFTSHNCMLKQHIAIVHEGKRYPCEICGAEFTTPDKKRVHIGNIHKGIKHKCEHCGRDFTLKDTLKTHINAVHKKIKHKCDMCSQEFSIVQDLRQHIKAVHQGIKSRCEFCGKDFNRPQEMKRHQRKVHQDHLTGVPALAKIEMVASKIDLVEIPTKIEAPAQIQAIPIIQQPPPQNSPQQPLQHQLQQFNLHPQQLHQTLPPQQPLQHHQIHHIQPQIMTAEQLAQLTQHVILTTTADGQTITQTITSL